jgi:hypothetical protein
MAGKALACAIFGQGCPGPSSAEGEQTVSESRYVASEYAAKIAAAKAAEDRHIGEARQRVEGILAGAGSGELRMRDLDSDSDLQVAVVPGAFGTTQVKPTGIFKRLDVAIDTSKLTPLRRLRCAQALLRSVADRSTEATSAQRRQNSAQAANYLTASPAMVSCPPDNELPNELSSIATIGTAPEKELLIQSKAYERIFAVYEQRVEVDQRLKETKQARMERIQEVERASSKVEEAERGATTDDSSEKRSAMEAARRALNEAKANLALQERLLSEHEDKAANLDQQLRNTQELMEQVKRDPAQSDDVLRRLGQNSTGE